MWLTTGKQSSWSEIAGIWKRITRLQKEADLPAYSAIALETRGGLHGHVIFVGSGEISARLQRAAFGDRVKIDCVHDADGIAQRYLAKERTPQAGYGRWARLGGRLKGSHRLEGGGDRVRLSRELERDVIEAGLLEVWLHTNAKRSECRKPYRKRRLSPRKAPVPSGQLTFLPELEKPVSRLHDFGGGMVPPAVALEIEFLRRQRGWSQTQLAAKIGRCQGHVSNALRGHDPLSSLMVNRLRELLPPQCED